jgi:hypothetical protein
VRRAAWLVGLLALGCAGSGDEPPPDASQGIELVQEGAVVDFYERASAFYGRLARRRFDSIETYQDAALRSFFRDEQAYADYYADLASALVEAHFEKNRPLALEVMELRLEGPGRARVETRISGEDSRPLRRGTVHLDRTDRWERTDETWRIEPGRG